MSTDLATLANIAEILGALTLISGAVFAVIQIREFRAQRRDAFAVELMRLFHDPELTHAVNLLLQLPDGISAEDLRARDAEYERAAVAISATYETIGLLVFRGMTSYAIVRELTGGIAIVIWRKLENWTATVREENAQPSWSEWFQWLVEQLAREQEQIESEPAYTRHTDWRPSARDR